MSNDWARHAIWWQVYPLGFVGAPIREPATQPPTRTLRTLIDWLDYLVELGCNGLLLGPIFASVAHGYDTLDYFRIDPRLGTEDDWDELASACRDRGIRICLDGVFNHVSSTHPWTTTHPERCSPTVFEGHTSLVELNHANPAVADYVVDVMQHWLGRGADAWRLDAAYTTPAGFWSNVLPRVRDAYPDTWIFGEVIHGDYPAFVSASGVNSVTQYELWKATWSSLKEQNFFELDWTLKRHNALLDAFSPQTFIGNHDVTRIATQVGADKAVLALTVLMTVGGVPSIYYGDEQGFTATKEERFGGDDDIRPAFPERPEQLSTLGAWMYQTHQQLISIRRRYPWLVEARTTTLHLTNTALHYCAAGPDASLWVTLGLEPQPSAIIHDGHAEVFRYPAIG